MREALGVLLALALTMSACSGGGTDQASEPSVLDRDDTGATQVWARDLPVVSEPEVSDGMIIAVVTAKKDQLQVIGVNAESGETVWTRPFSPGNAPTGYGIDPLVTDSGDVAYIRTLSPKNPGYSRIEMVDPQSGKVTMKSKTDIFAISPLSTCESGDDICVRGYVGDDIKNAHNYRIDTESGATVQSDEEIPDDARSLAHGGLFSTSDRPGEKIGVRRDGTTLWEKPVADMIGKGYSSDGGWAFRHDEKSDLLTGGLGQDLGEIAKRAADVNEPFVRDLGKERSISFVGATGEVIWNKRGTDVLCAQRGVAPLAKAAGPVRCVASGTVTFREGDDTGEYADVAVTIEGYDPKTGDATWSTKLSPTGAEALVKRERTVLSPDATFMVVGTPKGQELLRTKDGKSVVLDKKARFACAGEKESLSYAIPGRKAKEYYAARRVSLCDATGATIDGELTASAVEDGGVATSKSGYVVLTEGGLAGYTTAKPPE